MSFERIWHQSYAPGVPPAIEPERITMAEVLRRTASRFPDLTAFIFMGRKITFRELESLVNRFTRALANLGVRAGDKVATLLPNLPQHVIANHACYRLGAVTVMNNPLYSEREFFDHPKILEACAIGVSDAYRGETIKAFVVVKPGESLTEEEIIAYCKGKLAAYKIPKIVEFIAELPKSAVGKVLRRELKEMERKKREREGNGPSTGRSKQGGE